MKQFIASILALLLLVVGCTKKTEKDNWLEEAPEVKFSKEREKEVWGKVLRGKHSEIFYGSSLYDAAKAIKKGHNNDLKKLIENLSSKEINYQEPKFETTLGHFALRNENLEAIKLLLDKGLNPNIISKNGSSVITNINDPFKSRLDNSLNTLKYIIKKGGDVNLLNTKKNTYNRTPLIVAAASNLDNVKVLIKAGANPNFIYKDIKDDPLPESPLMNSLIDKRIDIINYLIFEVGINYKKFKYLKSSKYYPEGYRVLGALRKMTFPLDSEKYKKKMKLVNYLSEQGLDYWSVPVPKYIKKNPNYNTEEYLSKY